MSIESKTVRNADEYSHFGWNVTGSKRSGVKHHHTDYTIERDLNMNNYNELKKLEEQYFSLKSIEKYYDGIEPLTCLILFLLLIIPGFIYVSYCNKKKKEIKHFNDDIDRKMKKIIKDADFITGGYYNA